MHLYLRVYVREMRDSSGAGLRAFERRTPLVTNTILIGGNLIFFFNRQIRLEPTVTSNYAPVLLPD
jgi:hypothetical protein